MKAPRSARTLSPLARARSELKTNDRQWAAFTLQGHVTVLAPPGSGKTKLLTTRLAEDLLTSIPRPHGAACITLTNAAADELERRLEDLAIDRRSTLFVGTVHSFALGCIVRPYARLTGRTDLLESRIATDSERQETKAAAIESFYDLDDDTRLVAGEIDRLRKLMDATAYAKAGERLTQTTHRYSALLAERGLTDFEDIIAAAVAIVEENEFVRRALAVRYPHLYVDEYQDLAPGLHRLVRALCFDVSANAQLYAVGDPDQAIYGFTGTRPELLLELSKRPDVQVVHLDLNYRCRREIIRVSTRALGEERTIEGVAEGGSVELHECPDGFFLQQLPLAVDLVLSELASGTSAENIGILTTSNKDCGYVAEALVSADVPTLVRDTSIYRPTLVTGLIEALAAWATQPRGESGQRLGDLLRRWRFLGIRGQDVALVRLMLDISEEPDGPAARFVDELHALGLKSALAHQTRGDDATEVAKLHAALRTGPLVGFSVEQLGARARSRGRVYVTTMTASKGLEFDAVLMLTLDEGKLPDFRSRAAPQLAEERRKFYVSITRARRIVHLLYSGWVQWSPSGNPRYDGPSQFLRQAGLL